MKREDVRRVVEDDALKMSLLAGGRAGWVKVSQSSRWQTVGGWIKKSSCRAHPAPGSRANQLAVDRRPAKGQARPQALAWVRGAASTYLFIVPVTTGRNGLMDPACNLHHRPAALTTWYLV